jgi:SPP1 gp7 family putative phage head morphogenesis protein
MSNYWKDRMAQAQNAISDKNLRQIKKQFKKYYATASKHVIDEFEATYNKLLLTVGEGREPTPADLYKLDKYWQMQGNLRKELNKLGERQIATLTRAFEINYFEVYHSISLEGLEAFSTIDKGAIKQLINNVWVADGKSWSDRVWNNTTLLSETLNEELISIIATGRKDSHLKKVLQERFGVAYNNADMLAKTEIAHIQTQAAQQRYKDYGLKEVEVWADYDERRCAHCGKLHQQRFPIGGQMPVPAHPRCRCCVIPVVEKK